MTMMVMQGSRIGIRVVLTSMILKPFLYVVVIVSAAQTAGDYIVLNEDDHTSLQQVERLVNENLGKVRPPKTWEEIIAYYLLNQQEQGP